MSSYAEGSILYGTMAKNPRSSVEGNERLTALLAIVLLLTLFVVGLTVPLAQSNTRLHILLGTLVIPPVLYKVGSTSWRMVRYYTGDPEYVKKGPPFIILRLFGPVLVVLTVVLLFSGVGLVVWAPKSMYQQLWFLHRASFVLWFFTMAIHVLAHLKETIQYGPRDLMSRTRRQVAGASSRVWVTLSSLVLGVVAAMLIAPYAHNGGYFFGH